MDNQTAAIDLSIDHLMRTEAPSRKGKKVTNKLAQKYGTILDNFVDVIFITDMEGRFLFVNKASEQRTGIPIDKLIGKHFLEILDPKYHEFARSTFQKALSGEKPIPVIEMERHTESGEKITVETNWAILYEDNVAVGILGDCRDVTDRKRAERALKTARDELEMRVKERTAELQKTNKLLKKQIKERIRANKKLKESEEKYRTLFENSGDAVFIADIETGIILDANFQAERLTGRPRQEIIGMHQSQLHPAEGAEYYKEKFKKHIKSELVFDLEAEVVKNDVTIVPVFISASLINLQGKNVIQGIFRDISKEKMISDLKIELASRKLINRAKLIIANHYKISDGDALRLLQRESRRQSRKLKEVAQAVVSSEFILD